MSKTTTDVIGAIIAVIIFWVSVQYFIGDDNFVGDDKDIQKEEKKLIVEVKEK